MKRMEPDTTVLSLKWNNHQSTFFHVLSNLRKKELYTDATIACEGRFFPVHKLVISTCSDYFSDVFTKTDCKSPVIILKDISTKDLEYLLNYIYVGEVKVEQQELPSLLRAAECLQIKGLAMTDLSHVQLDDISPTSSRKVKKVKRSNDKHIPQIKREPIKLDTLKTEPTTHNDDSSKIEDFSSESLHNFNREDPTDEMSSDSFRNSNFQQLKSVPPSDNPPAGNFLEIVQSEEEIACDDIEECTPWVDASSSSFNQEQDDVRRDPTVDIKGLDELQAAYCEKDHKPIIGTARRRCVPCGRSGKEKRTKIMCSGCEMAYCVQCFTPNHTTPI